MSARCRTRLSLVVVVLTIGVVPALAGSAFEDQFEDARRLTWSSETRAIGTST